MMIRLLMRSRRFREALMAELLARLMYDGRVEGRPKTLVELLVEEWLWRHVAELPGVAECVRGAAWDTLAEYLPEGGEGSAPSWEDRKADLIDGWTRDGHWGHVHADVPAPSGGCEDSSLLGWGESLLRAPAEGPPFD